MKKKRGYYKTKKEVLNDTFLAKLNGNAKTIFHVDDGDREFFGTADTIVFNMRFWDTASGRCNTNVEYMKLVTGRIHGFPICTDEVEFLNELKSSGFIDIEESN